MSNQLKYSFHHLYCPLDSFGGVKPKFHWDEQSADDDDDDDAVDLLCEGQSERSGDADPQIA